MSAYFGKRPWRELASIPMPTGVSLLPKNERGYPIPWFVGEVDGKRDFRTIDAAKHRRALEHKLCSICGYHFGGKPAAFVGGPRSIQSHWFSDGPLHEECAVYALKVCPWLAAPKWRAHHLEIKGALDFKKPGQERPETFFMGISDRYRILERDLHWMVQAGEWLRTEKWQRGTRVL